MKNSISAAPSQATLAAIQRAILSNFFKEPGSGLTLSDAVNNLGEHLGNGTLVPAVGFTHLDAESLSEAIRKELYRELFQFLPQLVQEAMNNLEDITSGLDCGIYAASENPDIDDRKAITAAFVLCAGPSAPEASQDASHTALPETPPGVDRKAIYALLREHGEYAALHALSQDDPAGVVSLDGGKIYTYEAYGESAIVFSPKLRQQVEFAIGQPLSAGHVVAPFKGPGIHYLVFPSSIREQMKVWLASLDPDKLGY